MEDLSDALAEALRVARQGSLRADALMEGPASSATLAVPLGEDAGNRAQPVLEAGQTERIDLLGQSLKAQLEDMGASISALSMRPEKDSAEVSRAGRRRNFSFADPEGTMQTTVRGMGRSALAERGPQAMAASPRSGTPSAPSRPRVLSSPPPPPQPVSPHGVRAGVSPARRNPRSPAAAAFLQNLVDGVESKTLSLGDALGSLESKICTPSPTLETPSWVLEGKPETPLLDSKDRHWPGKSEVPRFGSKSQAELGKAAKIDAAGLAKDAQIRTNSATSATASVEDGKPKARPDLGQDDEGICYGDEDNSRDAARFGHERRPTPPWVLESRPSCPMLEKRSSLWAEKPPDADSAQRSKIQDGGECDADIPPLKCKPSSPSRSREASKCAQVAGSKSAGAAAGGDSTANKRSCGIPVQQAPEEKCSICKVLRLQVQALAQSLAGLGARVFNFSSNLNTSHRRTLAVMIFRYMEPCAHIEKVLEKVCAELRVLFGDALATEEMPAGAARAESRGCAARRAAGDASAAASSSGAPQQPSTQAQAELLSSGTATPSPRGAAVSLGPTPSAASGVNARGSALAAHAWSRHQACNDAMVSELSRDALTGRPLAQPPATKSGARKAPSPRSNEIQTSPGLVEVSARHEGEVEEGDRDDDTDSEAVEEEDEEEEEEEEDSDGEEAEEEEEAEPVAQPVILRRETMEF